MLGVRGAQAWLIPEGPWEAKGKTEQEKKEGGEKDDDDNTVPEAAGPIRLYKFMALSAWAHKQQTPTPMATKLCSTFRQTADFRQLLSTIGRCVTRGSIPSTIRARASTSESFL